MLDPFVFARFLKEHLGIFAGVPDSLLKPLNTALSEVLDPKDFYTCANEGQAVALASAHFLATSKLSAVYLQNSGLGNAINPLLSLSDNLVYGLPLVLIIGMRGGENDEPQHKKQGLVTKNLLDACGIPHFTLSSEIEEAKEQCLNAFKRACEKKEVVAILVQKNSFLEVKLEHKNEYSLKREDAIKCILDSFKDSKFISTTGMISRELYELREKAEQTHNNDFLVVGSMGYASSIAYIISKYTANKVVCLDGDGAFIMHLGSLALFCDSNFVHIVLNNFAHDSVGGQATNAKNLDFVQIAKASGYKRAYRAKNLAELDGILKEVSNTNELIFIEVLVSLGARKDLGRPKDIQKLKEAFCYAL